MYFEAHLTVETSYKDQIKAIGEKHKWKYSEINGDPDLGPGTRCYLTKHYKHDDNFHSITNELDYVLYEIRGEVKFTKVRHKIELVMFDLRG